MGVKVWVDLGGALAEAWLLAYFLHVLLGRMRWCRQWNLLGYGLLTFLVWVGSMRLEQAYTLMLANMLLYVCMAVWGYRGKLATKAFAGVFYLLCAALIENSVYGLLILSGVDSSPQVGHTLQGYVLGMGISKYLLLLFTSWGDLWLRSRRGASRPRGDLSLGNFLLLMFFPLVTIVIYDLMYHVFSWRNDQESALLMILLMTMLLAANMGVLVLYERLLAVNELERQHLRNQRQLQKQQTYYQAMNESNQALYVWRHEIDNLLSAVSSFLQEGAFDKAQELINSTRDGLNQPVKYRTGNLTLDTLFAEKLQKARALGADVSYKIRPGFAFSVDVVTLLIVLGNGLDNALEAVAKLDEPQGAVIGCRLDQQQGWLRITITNPVARQVTLSPDALPRTDKPDAAAHGLGLATVRQLCEQNKGWLTLECSADAFYFEAVLEDVPINPDKK